MSKIWSDLPHKSYSVFLEGQQVGIGMLPIWDQVPGAWNILQLVWSDQLEALQRWSAPAEQFPLDCGYVPFCVGMALQRASEDMTWGDIADKTTPTQFLKLLSEHPQKNLMILPLVFGASFWNLAQFKADLYREDMANVFRVDFGQNRRIQ